MTETKMGYRGSKSILKYTTTILFKLTACSLGLLGGRFIKVVKEQRVDGSIFKSTLRVIRSLRCTLMGNERNSHIQSLSKQLNKPLSFFARGTNSPKKLRQLSKYPFRLIKSDNSQSLITLFKKKALALLFHAG